MRDLRYAARTLLKTPFVTGVAILSLALTTLNARDHALYDGSWADWGSAIDTPVVTGA